MLEDIVKELNEQFSLKGLKLLHEEVNQFVFETQNVGHITVNKDSFEAFSTLGGFMGVLM